MAVGHAGASQAGRAGTVELGRGDLAQWHLIYIFIFSEYIQIVANSKICVGFI
jgi:hypothetical protein